MKKRIRLLSLILTFVMLLGSFFVLAAAKAEELPGLGMMWPDEEEIKAHIEKDDTAANFSESDSEESATEYYEQIIYGDVGEHMEEIGDVDENRRIDAADARAALRAAAMLDVFSHKQSKSADINSDGEITAADARQILRVSAKLDTFKINVGLQTGEKYVITNVRNAGAYCWKYTVSPETGLDVNVYYIHNYPRDPNYAGTVPEQIYAFTAKKTGVYEVTFTFGSSDEESVYAVTYIFNIK